jgi:RNA ligase
MNQNVPTQNIFNLPSISEFYSHKYVKSVEWNDLVLFHYKQECTYDKAWDNVTLNARGIIFSKVTGELVARPWKKFFNLNELFGLYSLPEYTNIISTLNNNLFYVLDKLDGSMGILYKYGGEYRIATKGSFTSEQALWATNWIQERIKIPQRGLQIDSNLTYLFEIIYPSNKIVVDYGDMEELVLTGIINNKDGSELGPDGLNRWAKILMVQCAASNSFQSLDELATYCKTLPFQREGFVVTFPATGLKVKVKGDEYLRIHKIISNLTPLAFWEAWDIKERKIPAMYLQQVPEEFREFTDEMAAAINNLHNDLYNSLLWGYDEMVNSYIYNHQIPFTIKEFAIECQKNHKENMSLLINLFKAQYDKLWENIHKRVRPNGNVLPEGYKIECDIHGRVDRALDDG